MPRRVCLAIGVSSVTPREGEELRFAYLDGAPLAAEAMGQWALRSGFGADNVRVVTDESPADGQPTPVTSARLQAAVDALFPANEGPTDHVILSFCGHGLTADVNSTFWLLSDAILNRYRVNVQDFTSELLTFGIKRLSLISDACRDAPRDLDLMRLESRRAIDGRRTRLATSMSDRLAACQDGQRAYMVVDPTGAAPGKCILSGVVLDVLWGHESAAFHDNVIDTHSFGRITRDRASQRATSYGYTLHPECLVDPTPEVLVDGNAPPQPPFDLPPWPASSHGTSMGNIRGASAIELPSTALLDELRTKKSSRDALLGHDFGTSHPGLGRPTDILDLPDDSSGLVETVVNLRAEPYASKVAVDLASTISALEGKAASETKAAAARSVSAVLDDPRIRQTKPDVNLIVSGGKVRHLWADDHLSSTRIVDTDPYAQIDISTAGHGSQLVVEFDDGVFVPVYLYPSLRSIVVRGPHGMVAVAYAKSEDPSVLTESAMTIDELTRGTLDSTKIERLAARIRHGKHENPVLGAVAAHLYRLLSDFDNLRRMAYYYVAHHQPIPFDIVLLGQMDVHAEPGGYVASVPAVPKSKHEHPAHNPLPDYVSRATPAVTGRVAGRSPWLTIGWDYSLREAFADRAYAEFRGDPGLCRPSIFTSFSAELGERLVRAWKLKRQ
jgi:hypothetical protein